ncbi:hypothetical protein ACRAWF_11455 [Streptomyces sp. L7]
MGLTSRLLRGQPRHHQGLLARQVVSRRNVAEMFGNVGRRRQQPDDRQLALIDAVERGETDPALLERLYSIDHIAVRLRRNADSLMLLAGIRETVLDGGPTELHQRRTGRARTDRRLPAGGSAGRHRDHGGARHHRRPHADGGRTPGERGLVLPAEQPVEVVVRTDGDDALIVVADHGLGMSADRIAEENARLIRRERLDLVPTKVLGLFVVGTLARRWDIDVTLARTPRATWRPRGGQDDHPGHSAAAQRAAPASPAPCPVRPRGHAGTPTRALAPAGPGAVDSGEGATPSGLPLPWAASFGLRTAPVDHPEEQTRAGRVRACACRGRARAPLPRRGLPGRRYTRR